MALMGGDKAPCMAEALRFEVEENVTGEITCRHKTEVTQCLFSRFGLAIGLDVPHVAGYRMDVPSCKCLRPLTFDVVQRCV